MRMLLALALLASTAHADSVLKRPPRDDAYYPVVAGVAVHEPARRALLASAGARVRAAASHAPGARLEAIASVAESAPQGLALVSLPCERVRPELARMQRRVAELVHPWTPLFSSHADARKETACRRALFQPAVGVGFVIYFSAGELLEVWDVPEVI